MSTYLRVTSDLNAEKPVLFSKFGIKGDGKAFDDKGVASLLAALDDAGTVHLGGNPSMLLGETVTLSDRASLTVTTDREPNTEQRHASPCFLWDGQKGGDMLMLDRCRNVTLDGFTFETDDFFRVKAPAGRAIVLDGGQDTHPESSAIGTTCRLKNLRHVTYPGPLDTEATFITIAPTTQDNQEFHEIIDCGGNGNGRGSFVHIGRSANPKNIRLTNSRYITAYQKAVWVEGGTLKLEHNKMDYNEWDLYLNAADGAVGYITEDHHIGEGSRHHAFINMPFAARYGTYQHGGAYPRSTPAAGLPVYIDDPAVTYEEAFIIFGGFAADVAIERSTLSGPPGGCLKDMDRMEKPTIDTRFFGWMDDRSLGRYEIGPCWLGRGHTQRTLGIDTDTLAKIKGSPQILFHDRAHPINPNGPGVLDVPTGELRFP